VKSKIYFSPKRYLLFTIIPLSLLFLALVDRGVSKATTLEEKTFLNSRRPMLGFKISYPSD
jgi:hypothetical protein